MPLGYLKLPVFDQYPLVLPLNIMGASMLAINLHWIPAPLRVQFINVVVQMYERYPMKDAFRLWYNTFKSNPALSFALIAVRRYYIGRCSSIKEIPAEHWHELPAVWNTLYKARYLRRVTGPPISQ